MSLPSSVVLKAIQSENLTTSKQHEAITVDGEIEFLTEDKGLVKKIIKKGEGDTPPKGSKVSSKNLGVCITVQLRTSAEMIPILFWIQAKILEGNTSLTLG